MYIHCMYHQKRKWISKDTSICIYYQHKDTIVKNVNGISSDMFLLFTKQTFRLFFDKELKVTLPNDMQSNMCKIKFDM
jgi:hypothetical protein